MFRVIRPAFRFSGSRALTKTYSYIKSRRRRTNFLTAGTFMRITGRDETSEVPYSLCRIRLACSRICTFDTERKRQGRGAPARVNLLSASRGVKGDWGGPLPGDAATVISPCERNACRGCGYFPITSRIGCASTIKPQGCCTSGCALSHVTLWEWRPPLRTGQ
jgi:hypothetical protein